MVSFSMSGMNRYLLRVFLGLWVLLALAGCATHGGSSARWIPTDEQGRVIGTGFEAIDLMVACHAVDEVLGSLSRVTDFKSGLEIAVDPVVNDTRFTLREREFNGAIIGQLQSSAPRHCRIVASDDQVTPDFYLMGRLQRIMPEQPRDFELLLYSYQLVNAINNEVIWEDSCEVKTHLNPIPGELLPLAKSG